MDKYFKTLGVQPGASKDELKKAYRKLATQHHPDRGGNAEVFKEVSKAYDILTGKRQLSRAERQEQARTQQAQQQQYYPAEPTYQPPKPKPKPKPRAPEYVEYEYDHYEKCSSCSGKGQLKEYCKSCHGTGNSIGGGPKNEVLLERCRTCKAKGYHVIFICESCKGQGSIFLGKFKRGYWR